jgi:CheY-like chemotaxis protein
MQLSEGLWVAEVDPNQLESALLNLVINARDAMPGGGRLVVNTSNQHLAIGATETQGNLEPGDYVVLSVTDTGCGMPQSTIDRAFDPFFTTKPIGQGTGLGLSMIYGFTRQSRGHVAIRSDVGEGTTVTLFLPRFGGDVPQHSPVNVQHAPFAQNGETVLIVEDDPAVRVLVSTVLSELGYAFVEAGNADSAVPILDSTQRIDLLISDVGLPGTNGRQLAEIGRQYRPDLKVLFITGYAEHAGVRGGFLDPGMQMITKPFTFDLLTAKVREMIRI